MSHQKAILRASSKQAIENDIKSIEWKGEAVYPDYPNDYERSFGPHERFVVTEPRQEVLSPGEYTANGTETTPATFGDWVSHLVLPSDFDTSTLATIQED